MTLIGPHLGNEELVASSEVRSAVAGMRGARAEAITVRALAVLSEAAKQPADLSDLEQARQGARVNAGFTLLEATGEAAPAARVILRRLAPTLSDTGLQLLLTTACASVLGRHGDLTTDCGDIEGVRTILGLERGAPVDTLLLGALRNLEDRHTLAHLGELPSDALRAIVQTGSVPARAHTEGNAALPDTRTSFLTRAVATLEGRGEDCTNKLVQLIRRAAENDGTPNEVRDRAVHLLALTGKRGAIDALSVDEGLPLEVRALAARKDVLDMADQHDPSREWVHEVILGSWADPAADEATRRAIDEQRARFDRPSRAAGITAGFARRRREHIIRAATDDGPGTVQQPSQPQAPGRARRFRRGDPRRDQGPTGLG